MKLAKLLERLDYKVLQGDVDREITTLCNDSRKVQVGSVFVCITGAVSDGHEYAPQVAEDGAAAVIVEKDVPMKDGVTYIQVENSRYALALMSCAYYDYPAEKLKVIGITGTKGKTTTTYMVKSVLEKVGHKVGLIGTIEAVVGEEHYPAANTTPESITIQKYFRDMVDAGCDSCVMEVSSQGLMLHRTAGIPFELGIFTNLGKDHIGGNEHKDMDDYIRCKSLLFRQCKLGIGNIDDGYYDRIFEGATCRKETFGVSEKADFRATEIDLRKENGHLGIGYHVSGKLDMDVLVDIPGLFSVYNSLAAIAVCEYFRVPAEEIARVLREVKVRGRVEKVETEGDYTIMIDYAHNAMALESLLSTLKEYEPGRLITIFGCGGNRARGRRFEMGEVSGKMADFTVITSDNPRFEEPAAIVDDIETGIRNTDGEYVKIVDRKEAIRYAIEHAQPGDVMIIAGKGHEDYQEVKGVKHHMDDRDLIREVYEEMK